MNSKVGSIMLQSFILLVLFFRSYSQASCTTNCKNIAFFYEDIGCKPNYGKSGDCCPVKYDCSHLNKRPNDKCLLQGRLYNYGEFIPYEETGSSCQIGCRCGPGGNFTCDVPNCPEILKQRPNSLCFSKYELNKCCPTELICPPFDNLTTCKIDGETYYEGARFTPNNGECQTCVCQKGFDGKFVEPFCQRQRCFAELHHSWKIQSNCAVLYTNGSKCCPQTFICPWEVSTPTITKMLDERPVCVFGREDLNIGDKFEKIEVLTNYSKLVTKCECLVPPLVTCIQEEVYDV